MEKEKYNWSRGKIQSYGGVLLDFDGLSRSLNEWHSAIVCPVLRNS